MQRLLNLTIVLSILFISCGGPRVVIHDLGSARLPAPSPSVTSEASDHDTSVDQGSSSANVMVSSLPTIKGGNRALRKKITYPDQAIQNRIEGVVRAEFTINGQGIPTDVVVTEGIGHGCDDAVIRAIQDSEFRPGRGPEGSTVNFLWAVTVEFKL